MIRFIHTADVHLDSRLEGLAAYPGAPVEHLRTAPRRAFSLLVDRAIEEAVDFMVIAGDLYDGDWRDYNTGLFFVGEMRRLGRAGIPVVIVHGNHDAESEITHKLTLPDNVTVFGTRKAQTHRIERLRVALHGRSYAKAATTENLATSYPDPVPGWTNIGVLHTALDGHAAHAAYAPCSLAELTAKGYDYWALGHVHEYRIVSEQPWVVFPGNLQGRSVRELGPRGAVLVEGDGEHFSVQRLLLDVLHWRHLALDVSGTSSLREVLARISSSLADLVSGHEARCPIALRLTLTGTCGAHGELFEAEAQLRHDVIAAAQGFGDEVLWVEKVRVETAPPLDPETLRARADALADLQLLLERAADDDALVRELAEELDSIASRCPQPLVARIPLLESLRSGGDLRTVVGELVRSVTPGLVARLETEG